MSLIDKNLKGLSDDAIGERLHVVDDRRLFVLAEALRRGFTAQEIHDITKIDLWFLDKLVSIVNVEKALATEELDRALLLKAKDYGFLDETVAELSGKSVEEIRRLEDEWNIRPVYKMVDTCAAEFDAATPYYYSSYGTENESVCQTDRKKVLVIGSGPIRIGQGIEFDFCSVQDVYKRQVRALLSVVFSMFLHLLHFFLVRLGRYPPNRQKNSGCERDVTLKYSALIS